MLEFDEVHTLGYIITHVFCPLQLPDGDDYAVGNDQALADAICAAACAYSEHIENANMPQWNGIVRMLENVRATVQFESLDKRQVISQLGRMRIGDTLAFLVRAQNAAVIYRKRKEATLCESMEVSPMAGAVMTTRGKLVCSYPGPAIEVPNEVFDDRSFQSELANFLTRMNVDVLDSAPTTQKSRSTVLETRDTAHPRYITELLNGILRAVGHPAEFVRISKRVGDDVVWNNSCLPWRRSPLWHLIRVAIQTSMERSTLGRDSYKAFMLFFMCNLAMEAIREDFPNDLLHFMSTKISRRLRKLGSSVPDWLSLNALQTCTQLRLTLEKRWTDIQAAQHTSPQWIPSQLDLARDTQLSLQLSREYLLKSLASKETAPVQTHFKPDHRVRGDLNDFLTMDASFVKNLYQADPHITLYDVEQSVAQDLASWTNSVTDADTACVKLEILANKYSSSALKTYANNPEHLSVMLLTTIELWIALDQIAVKATPILADYSPEVPTALLENLLLRKRADLDRVRRAYDYLSVRHSRSHRGWSVFAANMSDNAFAVRYYKDSSQHQALKAKVEEAAQRKVDKRLVKLENDNVRHAALQREVSNIDHTFAINLKGREYHAKYKCPKCDLEKRLGSMQIAVCEWPLPAEDLRAATVIFELDCPISFNMWRSSTFHLLVDLCSPSPSPEAKDPYILLSQYSALNNKRYLVKHARSRISLASDTKPFVKTHYSKVSIPSSKDRVCVKNGLTFYGFDTHSRAPVSAALDNIDIKHHCTYELPNGRYRNLQKYVTATLHTSNEILADQADCDKDLSIHEFITFGHLRSGGSLQWLNILRELRDRTLSFRRPEVHFLLAQTASQVGPLASTGEWVWHQELREPSFCYALLEELESLVTSVEANWLEAVTMNTVSFLLSRLLGSSPNEIDSKKACGLLRRVRQKTFSWVVELSDKLAKTPEDEDLRWLLRDMAASCRSTFDVDPILIPRLIQFDEDIEALLSCSIFIHDNTPSDLSGTPAYSQLLLQRDQRLSLVIEGILFDIIQDCALGGGIDLAICKVWPGYRPGSSWQSLPCPNSRWISCKTAATDDQCSQVVHFNLLEGALLVDGKPLSRLPDAILKHPTYSQIFGEQVFDVIPADLPGMAFSTRGMISQHRVYFALRDKDLIIRAKHDDVAHVIELIPREKLVGDLPASLVQGHIHWLNLSTSTIEIRPIDKFWEHSTENWEIVCIPGQYRLRKGRLCLADIRSPTWSMVSRLLEPLDVPENLIIILSPVVSSQHTPSLQLSVDLPRYGLSFFMDEDGDFQSRNLRGMVYDDNQCTGTMFGLVNQLVLRPKDSVEKDLIPRRVLIPDGDVSFEKRGHHVRVEIETNHDDPLKRVTYQTYTVDVELGCLTGNVSMTNKLYRAYLHALTSSGCSIDPLTGRTGAEEALCLLRSAGCRSIMKLGPRDAELLQKIALLAPARTWYPLQMKRMQTVVWPSLPANAPYHELYIAAKAIKEHCERLQLFQAHQSDSLFQDFPLQDNHLLDRSALRAAYLLPPGFPKELPKANHDVKYKARDLLEAGSGEHRAYTAAYVVYHPSTGAKVCKDLQRMMESLKATVHGQASLSLQYNKSWLEPNLSSIWIQAYNDLRVTQDAEHFNLLFSLPAMAYGSPELSELVPTLMAFATHPKFGLENPPPYLSYDLSDGYRPLPKSLLSYLYCSIHPFEDSLESTIEAKPDESEHALKSRRFELYNSRIKADIKSASNILLQHWPSDTPPPCSLSPDAYDVENLTSKLQIIFSSCYQNHELREHLVRVQKILDNVSSQGSPSPSPQYVVEPCPNISPRTSWELTENQLFTRPAPSLPPRDKLPRYTAAVPQTSGSSSEALRGLIAEVQTKADIQFHHQYVSDLRTSAEHLDSELLLPSVTHSLMEAPSVALRVHYSRCRDSYLDALNCVKQGLGPRSTGEQAVTESSQWPRVTPYALFQCLASTSSIVLSEDWKKCLVELALLALDLQRSRRLLRLHLDNLEEEFTKELENEGCDGWNAEQHPDWLLVQLQGNILVRCVQVDVANEMISPNSGENTAMQLNMGEGKSSVIVPIVAAALADGAQIVRVIVPKALTTQMFQLLLDRLGGLANRRIYYLPFSRSLEVNQQQVTAIFQILFECMSEHGILVLQPEHVLSLKLVSVEKQLSGAEDSQLAHYLLDLQRWLHFHTRDILDESDEILHVQYQLVYTIGHQQPIEGFPERWTTTQQILGLVKRHARSLRHLFPLGVEFESGPLGSFPHFRILQNDVYQELIARIVRDVMAGLLPNFNFGQVPPMLKDALIHFISCKDTLPSAAQTVEEYFRHSTLWSGLLLLRGLLAIGILLYPFRERRWRVDYGLAPKRTMLAVPYRAKDVPAQRAEFGHPDIAIILTCLSYYYGGLSEDQLKVSFDILLKQDDPSSDYEIWVQECPESVPDFLQNLNGVNIKSSQQWSTHLLPLFSRNQATVDFYLSKVVFPREAKEFPSKLSCSGWDLAEKRERLLTGFSGTNDGRYLLPLHITQCDPNHQRGTNARVLAYLLQPENDSYMLTAHENGERRNTHEFLEIVVSQDQEIRVLLDIGAQMLDLQNQELAKAWLNLKPDISAAIYFDEDDELTVVSRDGTTQLLLSSPFAQQLDRCVIYLDDAHTRGTDIKFPRGFRAAVTLGPKVTKDRLVQGCMRMRNLGFGHSVMFFAPLEVDWSIRSLAGKELLDTITTADILHWAIRKTCNDIQQQAPHWAQQGTDHTSRYAIWSKFCENNLTPSQLSAGWLRSEAKSLAGLYTPHTQGPSNSTALAVPEIRKRCLSLGISSLPDIGMNEEQEREVVHEVEPEPHVQRPPRASPATHWIHPDVVSFVNTGIIPPGTNAFRPIFRTLDSTSAAINEAHAWSTRVLATRDFSTTVASSTGRMDDYLRPVQWVVSSTLKAKKARKQALVVLSPYEVNGLMPYLKRSKIVHLHLYTPRTTKSMRPCDDLMLYSIPKVPSDWTIHWAPIDQLNVFAGQLYLTDYSAYTRLCCFLCIHTTDLRDHHGIEVNRNGSIAGPDIRPLAPQGFNAFKYSRLQTLRALMNIRRKGMSFAPTHIGRILDGRSLGEREFDGRDDNSRLGTMAN